MQSLIFYQISKNVGVLESLNNLPGPHIFIVPEKSGFRGEIRDFMSKRFMHNDAFHERLRGLYLSPSVLDFIEFFKNYNREI